jgi:hypothetical protein
MATNRPSITAYHDPNPIYYSLTQPEFDQLCEKAKIPEKENTLFLLGIFIPSFVNLCFTWPSVTKPITALFVINSLIVIVSFMLICMQGRLWWSKRGSFGNYVSILREKPQIKMELTDIPEGIVRETK